MPALPVWPSALARVPALLRGSLSAVEILVGPVEEIARGVVGGEFGDTGGDLQGSGFRDRLAGDRALNPSGEGVGVAAGRLRQDHREFVAADPAGDVG